MFFLCQNTLSTAMSYERWCEFRESFVDWVADWPASCQVKEYLFWRGYSAWWSTNLVAKDNYDQNQYLIEAARLTHNLNYANLGGPVSRPRIWRVIAPFFYDLAAWVTTRFMPFHPIGDGGVFFLYFEKNLIQSERGIIDRHFSQFPNLDKQYGYKSTILLKLNPSIDALRHPLQWRKRIANLIQEFPQEVVIIDRFCRLSDVLSVHFFTLSRYMGIKKRTSRIGIIKKIEVCGVDCDKVLYDELLRSFHGNIQKGLLLGVTVGHLLRKATKRKILLSYLEFTSFGRPLYFFTKKRSTGCVNVSIQHTTVDKNKLIMHHRKREFRIDDFLSDHQFSPAPDYYFSHGIQAEKIIEEYYPRDRIVRVGCLKYDEIFRMRESRSQKKAEIQKRIGAGNSPLWLIAPTVGPDIRNILHCLKNKSGMLDERIVLAPPPHVTHQECAIILKEYNLEERIELVEDLTTWDLLNVATLVVSGYSSIALEAAIMGIPSVRFLTPEVMPLSEPISGIIDITDSEELELVFSMLRDNRENTNIGNASALETTVKRYFSEIDGRAGDRAWTALKVIDREITGGLTL